MVPGYWVVMHASRVTYAGLVCMVEVGTSYAAFCGVFRRDLLSSKPFFIFLLPSHQPMMNARHTPATRTRVMMLATPAMP